MLVKKTENTQMKDKELIMIDERAEQSEFQSKLTGGVDPLHGKAKPTTPQNDRQSVPTTQKNSANGSRIN
jgi:hypothetical protein